LLSYRLGHLYPALVLLSRHPAEADRYRGGTATGQKAQLDDGMMEEVDFSF